MEAPLVKQLQDKSYEKRKAATLDLEKVVHFANEQNDETRLQQIYQQLYEMLGSQNGTVRSGGLTGLVGVGIGLKDDIALHLRRLVPYILRACLNDTDAKSRFFAIESLYNIAKVAKGRILVYFNEIFDMMAKVNADSDASCRQAHELLDRCMRDIVSEEAARYVISREQIESGEYEEKNLPADEPKPFTLARFIPLLQDRIYVKNPFTRNFLLQWLRILISIPELELVAWLPSFLDAIIDYLNDPTAEVSRQARGILETLRTEMREAALLNGEREEAKHARELQAAERADADMSQAINGHEEDAPAYDEGLGSGEWVPGQGIYIDHAAVVEILLKHMHDREAAEDIHLLCLTWLIDMLHFCPETVVPFTPRLIQVILPAMSDKTSEVRKRAVKANNTLFEVIESLPVGPMDQHVASPTFSSSQHEDGVSFPSGESHDSQQQQLHIDGVLHYAQDNDLLNYQETVDRLMEQLVPEKEEGRLASAKWMMMLQQKAPEKIAIMAPVLFSVLTKFLSDQTASEDVIRSVLSLIAQISLRTSEVELRKFLSDILKIFGTDRTLLDRRGSTIVRHLCLHLNAERIYKLCAEILEKEEDLEFASSMVQNLNLFLITSPELADFRRRLKVLDTKDAQNLFSTLYRSWSHNAVSTLTLCLLAQAYEHSFALVQSFADLEITVSLLMQLDKLVQLLESPVFTRALCKLPLPVPVMIRRTALRLQLLEPDRYPFLFKALYGLLMLLPQSSAFATLRNRLSSVTALGYLHAVPTGRTAPTTQTSAPSTPSSAGASALRSVIRKGDDTAPGIRWTELLSHFRSLQGRHEKGRRSQLAAATSSSFGFSPESSFMAMPPENGAFDRNGGDAASTHSRSARRKTGAGLPAVNTKTAAATSKAGRNTSPSPAPSPAQGGGHRRIFSGSGTTGTPSRRPP